MRGFSAINSFNLSLVNTPLENLFPPESFSKIFRAAFKFFPTIGQVSNPVIFLNRPTEGGIQINPLGIFFNEIKTERFDEDLENLFQIVNLFHSECKISELKEISLKLVFYFKALIANERRKLLTYDIVMPSELLQSLPDSKVHLGLRFVFTVGITRYDLKIEPRFANLEENYIDFNVVIPKPIKTEEVLGVIAEQRQFFDNNILPMIAK